MKCTNCGNELTEGAKFCPECGTSVTKNRFCPNCGVKLLPEAKFCPECGTKAEEATAVAKNDTSEIDYNNLMNMSLEDLLVLEEKNHDHWVQYSIGLNYWEKDDERCLEWFNKVTERIPRAYFNLGQCYYFGHCGIECNNEKAFDFFKKAVDEDVTDAISFLADCYYWGDGIEKNQKHAFELYNKNKDDKFCSYGLGHAYYYGNGTEKNDMKARLYFKKSADAGYGPGCYYTGLIYQESNDIEKAYSYFMQGAKIDDSDCFVKLGRLYEWDFPSAKRDEKKAFEYYKKAAEAGNANGQYWLGHAYEWAKGTEQNDTQAKKWYEKAAAKGNKEAIKRLSETLSASELEIREKMKRALKESE